MSIIIFLVILLVLVLVHELGHFFSAKRFGIRIDEFGFGFPPKLFSFQKGETEYSFNLLPIGGFVKIFGENPNEENTAGPDAKRSFVNKPKWQQATVLLAGVSANFLLAWFLLSFGLMSGFPTSVGNAFPGYELRDVNLIVVSVLPDYPAATAGLRPGDSITSVRSLPSRGEKENENLREINPENLKSFILSHFNDRIEIGYRRGKNQDVKFVTVIPTKDADNVPMIGLSMGQIGTAQLPVLRAFWEGMKLTVSFTKETALGLFMLILEGLKGQGSLTSVTGPVGLVGLVGNAYQFGFVYLLTFTAFISINLTIINLLPFPALDGGRLFFLFIEKIKGSRLNPKVVNAANAIGFGLLILLMLIITYHDIRKLL